MYMGEFTSHPKREITAVTKKNCSQCLLRLIDFVRQTYFLSEIPSGSPFGLLVVAEKRYNFVTVCTVREIKVS